MREFEGDPFKNFRFIVDVGGDTKMGFTDVSGIDATIDVIEYRTGNDPNHFRKLSGLTKFSNITLKWGATTLDMFEWIKKSMDGNPERKELAIHAIDSEKNEIASWTVDAAWPAKYTGPTFDSKGNSVAIEQLDLAHKGITRTL